MLFAGSSVAAGDLTLFGVVAAGVLGNLVGSWVAYVVGYFGRVDLWKKTSVHVNQKHLKWAETSSPPRRSIVSLADAADHPHLHLAPAGVAKMPFGASRC